MFIVYIGVFVILLGNASAHSVKDENPVRNEIEHNFKNNYYDCLVNNLEQEVWEPADLKCKQKIIDVIENVQNFTLWAVWIWDSMSTNPVGNMMSSSQHLGNFDQCLMKTPWSQMDNKYCLTEIHLNNDMYVQNKDDYLQRYLNNYHFDPFEKADKYIHTSFRLDININELFWGVCLPIECNEGSAEKYARALLKTSYLGFMDSNTSINVSVVNCQNEKYSTFYKTISFLIIVSILFIITLISYNYYDARSTTKSLWQKIAKSFSLSENYKQLVKPVDGALDSINGIKFILSLNTVLIHGPIFTYQIFSNSLEFDEKLINYLALLRSDLAVDGFLCISALLVMKSLMSKSPNNISDIIIQILRRYMRLAPMMMFAILYQLSIAEIGHGPIYKKIADPELYHCSKNWWTNVLMIANVCSMENLCLPIAWSVSCDFQLFVCTLILFYCYKKGYIRNKTIGIITLTAMLIPGFVSYWNDFRPINAFAIRRFIDFRQDNYLNKMYLPTYIRCSSYIVGLIAGYFISTHKLSDFKGVMNRHQSIIGVALAIGVQTLVVLIGNRYNDKYGVVEEFMYTTFNRPVFAATIVIIIICLSYGDIPILKSILGHRIFEFTSKLSYSVYMLHIFIIARTVMISRSPFLADEFVFLVITVATFVLAYAQSFIFYFLVEAPVPNLVEQFVIPLLRKSTVKEFNKKEHGHKDLTSKAE